MLAIGDNVKIYVEGYKYNGMVGQILDIRHDKEKAYYLCPFPSIINTGSFTGWWEEDDLELLKAEEEGNPFEDMELSDAVDRDIESRRG